MWISNRSIKAFSRYWTETKFKMAAMMAILEKLWHPFSIGYVSFMGPIHPINFKWIGASVLLLLNGNQIQDGWRGGHIGKVTTPIFNMFFVLYGPNPPYEFQINWCKRSSVIERKPNSRWLPWRPYWKSYDIHFQKRFFSLMGPIHPVNFKSISPSFLLLLSENQCMWSTLKKKEGMVSIYANNLHTMHSRYRRT